MGRAVSFLLIVVVCVSVFIFFRTFSVEDFPPFAKEIMAAMLGSVITVAITVLLLRYQTTSEVNRDKSIAVFQEKLRIYEGFSEFLCQISQDGRVDEQEERALRHWAMKLSLICGQEVSDAIDHFFMQTHRYKTLYYEQLPEPHRDDLLVWYQARTGARRPLDDSAKCFLTIGALLAHLKHDLGEVEISNLRDVASARHAVDDIMAAGVTG
ncbi:MAG: hypothetical protein ACR2PI_04680 [Hyphomicrobiaceae bacterium]